MSTVLAPRHISYDAFLEKHRFVNDRQTRPQVIEFSAPDIPPITTSTSNQKLLFTGNKQAYVINGPYISLIPGKYQFMIRYKSTDAKLNNDSSPSHWEIMSNHGTENLKKIELSKSDDKFHWSTQFIHVENDTDGVGIRVYYGGHGNIEIDRIKIKKLPAS